MEYLNKLVKEAQTNRTKYYGQYRKEIMDSLEAMAANGEYDVTISADEIPTDILVILGDELRSLGLKYSVNSIDDKITLFVSIRHAVKDNT